ncbi:hypothetical protein L3Q82_020983, partial [Scortum barcoo]
VLNLERAQELETWLKTTNTKLTQVNGQRKYGGPPEVWDGPTPGAHCEVFISQIPRDTYEDLLIPLFSSVGPLWEFRLMMNFSGQNRGFAYAKYSSPAVAADAIRLLHGHMLQPGFCLSVRRSTEKRHLCIGDLPATTRQKDLLQAEATTLAEHSGTSAKTAPHNIQRDLRYSGRISSTPGATLPPRELANYLSDFGLGDGRVHLRVLSLRFVIGRQVGGDLRRSSKYFFHRPTMSLQVEVLCVLTEGVERVSLKAGPGIEGVSAIVAFSSHHTASMAKKMLVEAFKKQFALTISIKWQSTVKPGPVETLLPQKFLKSLLPLPSPLKPPRHTLKSPQPSRLPPCLPHPSSIPPGFCRIVGGPTSPQHPPHPISSTTFSSSRGHLVSTASSASPVMLLRKMCEATGVGQPLYEIRYSHAGPDGFLYFNYEVCIPGIAMAFKGLVMILPGPTTNTMLEEAQRAAAQQVLKRMYNDTI